MTLEGNATMCAPKHPVAASTCRPEDLAGWVLQQLPADSPRFIAAAPGRLDVLGGIAEYSGGLVIATPLGEYACAGVQRRCDGQLHIIVRDRSGQNDPKVFDISLARLHDDSGAWFHADAASDFQRCADKLSLCCVATVVEAFRGNLFKGLGDGLSVAVATNLGDSISASASAASASALLVSLAALAQEIIEPNVAARIALGAVAPTPILATKASDFLCGHPPSEAAICRAASLARKAARPITDMRGSIPYRRQLVDVLVRRALQEAIERARQNQREATENGV